MIVYDCIMFNDELDILELRLAYMNGRVDKFVIAESSLTHSNINKPLHFRDNQGRFAQYKDKIIYLEVPPVPQKDSWEGEFYQRNYLKTALNECSDDDVIIIADIDELIDLDELEKTGKLTTPCMIEMPMYYYFLNLKTQVRWLRTLVSPYQYLRGFNIGDRLKYPDLDPVILRGNRAALGWHLSYMFGWDTGLYISKLKSFSHQEFNTPYYLDERRITTCLQLGVDFLERNSIYEVVNAKKEFPPALYKAFAETGLLDKLLYQKPGFAFYLNLYHLKYFVKFHIKPRLKPWIDKQLGRR